MIYRRFFPNLICSRTSSRRCTLNYLKFTTASIIDINLDELSQLDPAKSSAVSRANCVWNSPQKDETLFDFQNQLARDHPWMALQVREDASEYDTVISTNRFNKKKKISSKVLGDVMACYRALCSQLNEVRWLDTW